MENYFQLNNNIIHVISTFQMVQSRFQSISKRLQQASHIELTKSYGCKPSKRGNSKPKIPRKIHNQLKKTEIIFLHNQRIMIIMVLQFGCLDMMRAEDEKLHS